jgi:glycosyltransferase involved in cell wall biosynthesis
MRIVLITAAAPGLFCGVGDYTGLLGGALADLGHDVTIVRGAAAGASAEVAAARGMPRVRAIIDNWSLSALPRLRSAVLESKPDVVHVQFPGRGFGRSLSPNFLLWTLRGRHRPRSVMTVHEYAIATLKGRMRILLGARVADALVFPDEMIAAQMRPGLARSGFSGISRIIPPAPSITAAPLTLDRAAVRARWHVPAEALAVGWFGLLTREKGADVLLAALRVARDRTPITLVVVGDIGDRKESMDLAAELKALCPQAVFTGPLAGDDVAVLLASVDVVALPFAGGISDRRTSYLGARAQGTYIVATDLTQRGYQADSNTFFVPPGDGHALAEAMLLARERGRRPVHLEKTWTSVAQAHDDLYRLL